MNSIKVINHLPQAELDINANPIQLMATNGINGFNHLLNGTNGHTTAPAKTLYDEEAEVTNISEDHMNLNAITNCEYTYEKIKAMADWFLARIELSQRPKLAIVCGSGLGGLGELLHNTKVFPYTQVPDFPCSTVQGHKGNLIFGTLRDVPVVCMQGRFHTYEGYSNTLCTLPIKVFKMLGVKTVLLTCAAGGVRGESLKVGDIMLIKDHIAPLLWGLQHPLVGHNDNRFGPRFPAANKIYKKPLRDLFRQVAKDLNEEVKEGVYVQFGGPSYETVSELRLMAQLGGDAVGMSTAHEALVASYCGMEVIALALITNQAVLEYDSDEIPNHEEVMDIANKRAKVIESLVMEFVTRLNAQLQ